MMRCIRSGWIWLPAAVLLVACNSPPAIPHALAGMPLTHSVQGDGALREISRLHGKRILARDGFVAHYERNRAVAMLYVSLAHADPIARWQFSRMVRGIENGQSNVEGRFFNVKARDQDGVTLYSALGLGQVHYFYRSGATIVWLAADPPVARAAVAETIRLIR